MCVCVCVCVRVCESMCGCVWSMFCHAAPTQSHATVVSLSFHTIISFPSPLRIRLLSIAHTHTCSLVPLPPSLFSIVSRVVPCRLALCVRHNNEGPTLILADFSELCARTCLKPHTRSNGDEIFAATHTYTHTHTLFPWFAVWVGAVARSITACILRRFFKRWYEPVENEL